MTLCKGSCEHDHLYDQNVRRISLKKLRLDAIPCFTIRNEGCSKRNKFTMSVMYRINNNNNNNNNNNTPQIDC
jgi:hypothetical protein